MTTHTFLCTICNREFKKLKDLNNHNKAKHPIEINKSIKMKLIKDKNGFKFKPDLHGSVPSLDRFIKFKNYLKKKFENNLEIYLPLKLHNTDIRILRPINNNENMFLNTDYLGIKSVDILIIRY